MKWQAFLQFVKKPNSILTTLSDIIVTNHYAYLDVAVVNELWDQWKLNDVFRSDGKRSLGVATIARILTINRCIDPGAKSQTPEWFRGTALHWLLDIDTGLINTSRIFRELEVIENHKESICNHLFAKISQDFPGSINSVFYDLSSTTFTGSHCVLMKWGHCKEGYFNHIVLAMVVNQDGLPFYWEVLPGGTADAKTVNWLLERLKDRFLISGTTLVFDRGMVSEDNLSLIEKNGIKYISAMDKSQLEKITEINFSQFSHLNSEKIEQLTEDLPGFSKLNSSTYYCEAKVDGNRRYILCFNPQLFKDQRKARNQAIEDFRAFVADMNTELLAAKKSRKHSSTYAKFKKRLTSAKLTGFVDVVLKSIYAIQEDLTENRKIQTFQASVTINDSEKIVAEKLDGFWLLVTNHTERNSNEFEVSAPEAITPYRNKVVIESVFRDIKSFIDIAPVYVWTEAHVKAHYTICVLAHLINRTIMLRLHKDKGENTNGVISHEQLYKKVSKCQIDRIEVENLNLSTYNMTRLNNEQKELINRLDLSKLITNKCIEKIKASSKETIYV
jgi:transposase